MGASGSSILSASLSLQVNSLMDPAGKTEHGKRSTAEGTPARVPNGKDNSASNLLRFWWCHLFPSLSCWLQGSESGPLEDVAAFVEGAAQAAGRTISTVRFCGQKALRAARKMSWAVTDW